MRYIEIYYVNYNLIKCEIENSMNNYVPAAFLYLRDTNQYLH